MSSALGITSSRGNSGFRQVDIRDFGAVPGESGAKATRLAVQAALDSLPYAYRGQPRTVYVPASEEPWCLDRPIYVDRSFTGLQGDPGGGSEISMAWYKHASCFLFGIPREAFGQSLAATHFIDLHGKLDATAASAPGQRWGIRTSGNAHVAQAAGPFSYGRSSFTQPDYWGKTRALTVEFATDSALTPFESGDGVWLGLSDRGQPQPFALIVQEGKFACYFKTSDDVVRRFMFPLPIQGQVNRVAFQIDLEAAKVAAFLDGAQVAVEDWAVGGGFTPEAGLSFTANLNVPFKFNAAAFHANTPGSDWWTDNTGKDRTLYGLRVSNSARFTADGPGQPQRRRDGAPINDLSSYFQVDGLTVALFPFQDDPTQAVKDRFLTVLSPAGESVALYLSANHGSTWTAKTYNTISDLTVSTHDPAYGEALTLGFALYLKIENCLLEGGAHGIGSWNWGANYVTRIRDCRLHGGDAAIYNNYGMMEAENLLVMGHGRSTFWINGGMFRAKNVFCDDGGSPEHIVRSLAGSDVFLENISVDIEADNGPYPSKAAFYAESSNLHGGTSGGRLRLKDVNFGTIGRDTPLVSLKQTSPLDPPAVFSLENLTLNGDEYEALVRVEGRSWRGEIATVTPDPVFPQVKNVGDGGGVVSRDDRMTGPPRAGRWETGSHVLEVSSPAPGQFSRWRCASGGEYGTANPPVWRGLDPLDAGDNSLAAYIVGHSRWTAGPETTAGFWTEAVHAAVLNRVFRGAAATTFGPLYLGLSTRAANRNGWAWEPSGAGYARIPVGPFTNDGGVFKTVQPIAFPEAFADWTDVRSLFLADAPGGGNVVAMIGQAPFSVSAGSTLGFGAGDLKTSATLTAGSFSAALFDLMHGSIFGGSALPAASLFLALSSEAANAEHAPVEPVGNGYARASVPDGSWTEAQWSPYFRLHQRGTTANAVPLAFPGPSGPWGEVRSVYLMDAPLGGNVVAAANLAVARAPDAGQPAPSFAPGALWASLR